MQLQYSELTNGIRLIKLNGTLDMNGVARAWKGNLYAAVRARTSVCLSIYRK